MAKLTPHQAAAHLHYIERQRAAGKMTPQLEEIERHRREFLLRSKCCTHCGTPLSREDSIEEWSLDGLGPKCRQKLAVSA